MKAIDEIKALSEEIGVEGGERDKNLRDKCLWEHMSRTAVLAEWPSIGKR